MLYSDVRIRTNEIIKSRATHCGVALCCHANVETIEQLLEEKWKFFG
jgi:hypothetical protein